MGDYRTTTGEALPPPKKLRRHRLRLGLLLALLFAVSLTTLGFLVEIDRYISAIGYVTTEEHAEVRPPMSGLVAEILVDSGSVVEAWQVVVRLDSSQEHAALEEARAVLRRTEADVARRQIEIAERRRSLAESILVARLKAENIGKKMARAKELFEKGLVPGSAVEDLELEREIAQSELHSLEARDLSLFERELEVLEQDVQARRDAVGTARLRVDHRDVKAPIGGQVLRYEFVIGELVRPETVLLEIFGGRRKVLRLRVAERFAAKIAVGQRSTAVLAPYRGRDEIIFEGRVESLRNVIQGDGDRTYRVAYCTFDPRGMTVSPGTTAQARIYYGQSTIWRWLFGLE